MGKPCLKITHKLALLDPLDGTNLHARMRLTTGKRPQTAVPQLGLYLPDGQHSQHSTPSDTDYSCIPTMSLRYDAV